MFLRFGGNYGGSLHMSQKSLNVVMFEDNEREVELFEGACRFYKLPISLKHYSHGDHFERFVKEASGPKKRPDIIIIDLNIPGSDGHEILARLRKKRSLRSVPTVVLTGSVNSYDILEAFKNSANQFLNKPSNLHQYKMLLDEIRKVANFYPSN